MAEDRPDRVTHQETFTSVPKPPDLKPFAQLDHPYTLVQGKCLYCVCPAEEHSDDYDVQSLIAHAENAEPLVLLLTRRSWGAAPGYDWYVIDESDGTPVTMESTEAQAMRVAHKYQRGWYRGIRSARKIDAKQTSPR